MDMPERSFGRTVRYRRTKLGLSQAKLGELVGRSTATIRAWERDQTRPNDPGVLSTLAAILAVDERQLFDKADVEPLEVETSPTVEQALASLAPQPGLFEDSAGVEETPSEAGIDQEVEAESSDRETIETGDAVERAWRDLDDEELTASPAYVAPPDPYVQTPLTPTLADVSYMEDHSQRQMYRVRTLATLVASVALVIAFLWAFSESLGALSEWWDEFFGNLRL